MKNNNILHLFIPDRRVFDLFSNQKFKNTIIQKIEHLKNENCLSYFFRYFFNLRENISIANTYANKYGLDKNKFWIFATPVSFFADRDTLRFNPMPVISDLESRELFNEFKVFFEKSKIFSFYINSNIWLLGTKENHILKTYPPYFLQGYDISQKIMREHGNFWRLLESEIQMKLHGHPINSKRENKSEHPINSLWFWGNGELKNPKKINEYIFSDFNFFEVFCDLSNNKFNDIELLSSGIKSNDYNLIIFPSESYTNNIHEQNIFTDSVYYPFNKCYMNFNLKKIYLYVEENNTLTKLEIRNRKFLDFFYGR